VTSRRNQRFAPALTCVFNAGKREQASQNQIAGLLVRVQSGEHHSVCDLG
jgi:hypothetical protein